MSNFADSATVLYGGLGSNAGHLIDTTPGSAGGKNDGGIQIGRTYSDPEADMHFTVVGKNATSPPSLDVAYYRGPFPGNVVPVASLGASATTISAGDSITFTVSATDANGDALAFQWDFSDGVSAENSAVVTRSFATAAQITAMVTVSDMKGGVARRHVVINVGSHGLQKVTGAITANSQRHRRDSRYGVDLPSSATLSITDDEVTNEQSGANGQYRDIAVTLSAVSASLIAVEYTGGGGTSTGDDIDWTFVDASNGSAVIPGGSLTFAPGVTTQNLRIRPGHFPAGNSVKCPLPGCSRR